MACTVLFSPDINQSDSATYNGKTHLFELNKANETGGDLILLYMYILPKFAQHGIKVGMAKCRDGETFYHALKKRIGEQEHELALTPEQFEKYGQLREIIYWGVCLDANKESFKDYHVHKEILQEKAGLTEREQEWFPNIPQDELIEIFQKVRSGGSFKVVYTPRKEQRECIDSLKKYFDKKPTGGRFLLNCKMRFGKSYTTYKYCEEAGINKILILTFIPAVESSWNDDLTHVDKEYKYFTDKNLRRPGFEPEKINEPYVLFLSLQNFLGKEKDSGETKEKIKKLQNEHFDLVILDEYHFGAWNDRTQEKLEDLDSDYSKELSKTKDVVARFGIKTDKIICLSGTPFKSLARGEFAKDNSFTYSYFDEQKNKYPLSDGANPDFSVIDPNYAEFPDMKIFGYNMSALFGNLTQQVASTDKFLNRNYFSLNKFFETKHDVDSDEPFTFIYEDEIKVWLEIIQGKSAKYGLDFPYSNPKMKANNRHTLWLMPSVTSCRAMEKLLKDDDYFSRYEIINLSQNGVGSGVDAYDFLLENIQKANNTNKLGSIALTVNKLTIGVTVKQWFSVFVLKDLAAPEQYFQSIFRIQTPYKDSAGNILKEVGYVYDFNIDRAAALLLKYAEESGRNGEYTKLDIAKLIVKYLPIFMNGDMKAPIAYDVFYQLAQLGDQSNIPLSRKITNLASTTHFDDEETLAAMLNDPEINDVFKKIFAHSKFKAKKEGGKTLPPPENGYEKEISKKGRDEGYKLGMADSDNYLDLDDSEVQEAFENAIDAYVKEKCPETKEPDRTWWINGFKRGYEQGVNVPIKKLQCGKEDGKKFANKEVKERFGDNVAFTKDTRQMIFSFVNAHLNVDTNIPQEYRKKLYKRWYCDSFKNAVKNELTPLIPSDDDHTSVADADNALRHILARLIEFLFISVYRETTFQEIFKNADPDVFLEAVGIKKEEFEALNKYHIFEEKTLNNYIHEFFVNESIGESLDLGDETIKSQYRNSFDWFGYGLSYEKLKEEVREFTEAQSPTIANEEDENKPLEEVRYEAPIVEKTSAVEEPVISEDTPATKAEEIEEAEPEEVDFDFVSIITRMLRNNPKGLRAREIASEIGLTRREVNQILYGSIDRFDKDFFGTWRLKEKKIEK